MPVLRFCCVLFWSLGDPEPLDHWTVYSPSVSRRLFWVYSRCSVKVFCVPGSLLSSIISFSPPICLRGRDCSSWSPEAWRGEVTCSRSPTTSLAPPPEPRASPPPPPRRAPRPVPGADVRAKRAGRAPPSRVLPRAPGSLGPRGGAALRGSARFLPSPVPSRGTRRCLRLSRRPRKKVSVGGSEMGPPGARSALPGIVWAGAARARARPSPTPPEAPAPWLREGGDA